MVAASVSNTDAERCGGSSPSIRTNFRKVMIDYRQYCIDRQAELIRFQVKGWLDDGMTVEQLENMVPMEPNLLFENIVKELIENQRKAVG